MAIGIYKITNMVNGKVYIGQSRNTSSRWYQHKQSAAKSPRGDDSYLVRSLKKYGIDNFTFEVLETCTVEELNDREKYWINQYNSFNSDFGYNRTLGGSGHHLESNVPTRFNISQIEQITKDLQETKLNNKEIAEKYNTTTDTIANINHGHTWVREGIEYPIRKERIRRAIPTKEELIESLVKNGFPTTYRKFKTTLPVLKRWCKRYGIPDNYQEFQFWYYKK